MTFYSPLRYPGGKKRLIEFFKESIRENNLEGGTYVEPYSGGSSIALTLLIEGHVSKIIINDLDRSIYAFWHSVLFETEKLCDLIKRTPLNIKNWRIQKEVQKTKEGSSLLELGFSTFFLNRTNRSGILKAGAIGGLKQRGEWKINARYNKRDLIKRIKKIAFYKDQIELHNQDVMILMKEIGKRLPKKTLIYFDPPYYVKGKDLYMNHYNPEDHYDVAVGIKKIKHRWIITYDCVPPIEELYRGYKRKEYFFRYSAGSTGSGKEVVFFSRNLRNKQSILKLPRLI